MQLGDLKSKMELEWPSLACPSCDNAWFWQYEWGKHGTCVLKNQYDYFATALRLKESVDLLGALGNNSIYPDGKKYNLSENQRVLGNVTRNGVGIECNRMEQLCQVYICVDKNASHTNISLAGIVWYCFSTQSHCNLNAASNSTCKRRRAIHSAKKLVLGIS